MRPTKSRKEREEFGGGKQGVVLCPVCKAAYYKNLGITISLILRGKEDVPVKFMLCPADRMINNKQYEGKVIVKNISERRKLKAANLIKISALAPLKKSRCID